MAYLLGVDTGGTYTDAVIIDDEADKVVGSAKSLTTRPDLALGVGRAIDAALADSSVRASDVAMVSLSTTLATNALVEGQGGKVALVFIGFEDAELNRAGLIDALNGDPVIALAGGHNHAGSEVAPLDLQVLETEIAALEAGISGFAVASSFATRNSAHEIAARDLIRAKTDLPVTCSHELSSALGGPKRALTAVLNARLIGMIDRLISACENHLTAVGIDARLMVVRGDGALVSADMAREKPIETILSGPAASIAGASWLTGETDALVSDIGGTTTDVCLLRDGRPKIDPEGARVGPYRTMIEAVAMRTSGLGGDSEVHVETGLNAGLRLGPRRVMPVSLLAEQAPELVIASLERALASEVSSADAARFVVPLWEGDLPAGLDSREAAVATRLSNGPLRYSDAVTSRIEAPALGRLVGRGLAIISSVTPSDAAHVLGLNDSWNSEAAILAMTHFARQRDGGGDRLADGPEVMARRIIDKLTEQTVDCLLASAFTEDDRDFGQPVSDTVKHPLTRAGLDQHAGIIRTQLSLGVPVIGLGASAPTYYGAVGDRLNTKTILPKHAGVANAIGAVVGQVSMHASGAISASGPGTFVAHLPDAPATFNEAHKALSAMEDALTAIVTEKAIAAGVADPRIKIDTVEKTVEVEGSPMFVSAEIKVTAQGRPRIASE